MEASGNIKMIEIIWREAGGRAVAYEAFLVMYSHSRNGRIHPFYKLYYPFVNSTELVDLENTNRL